MRNMFPQVEPIYEEFVKDGVRVEFTVKAEDTFLGSNTEVAEGAYATVRFRVTNLAGGNPLTDVRPAAWMDLQPTATSDDEQACQEKVAGYLKGQISNRPLVDLNSFFILAMNSGNSISVIDPLVQVGGITQLYTTLLLESPGEDWAASPDGNRLYVSLPKAGKVAVAELQAFRVTDKVLAGDVPVRVALHPGGETLWVGNDSASGGKSGVSVIDTRTLELLASLKTGGGHHELAFSPDGKYVLATNESDGTLTLIDAGSMKIVRSEKTGQLPVGVAVSPDGRLAFVANGGDGTINIFSLPDLKVEISLNVEPGLTGMQLSPDGRWAFVLNPNRNKVYIIDTTKSELRHTLEIAGAPDQVAFSQQNAYIRPLNGTSLMSMALSSLEGEQAPSTTEIPYAQRPPGQSMEQALANPVATLPDEGAVLIANPADNLIYYLLEGTLAPAGSYQDQATLPRAVRFVDRSLRQEAPGIYSGKVRIPAGGDYQVALLLDSPRLVHCFNFTAKPGEAEKASQGAGLQVEYVDAPSQVKAGQPFKLQLRASDPSTGQPVVDLADLVLLASQTGGNWNRRYLAAPMGDGLYEVELNLPQPGMYQILLSATSRGAGLEELPRITLEATKDPPVTDQP